jgi:DNA-binding NtrC family response regulator
MPERIRKPTVLIVDDEVDFAQDMAVALSDRYDVTTAGSPDEALRTISRIQPRAVLLDVDLQAALDGLDLLERIATGEDGPLVIMLTRDMDVRTVVKAVKLGAYDYVVKPPDIEALIHTLERGLRERALAQKVESLEKDVERAYGEIVAADENMLRILREVDKVARTDATVLITGESGVGKELVARRIHKKSDRADQPFVAFNCAAVPKSLIESELFGHERGAFTGAERCREGMFKLADGGILFLDEVGDSPDELQAKLLRAIEEQVYYRVGGEKPQRIDVRVLAATSHDLERDVEEGRFRDALYYRLNVYRIHIPPLRKRPGDIVPIARHFLKHYAVQVGKDIDGFTPKAEEALKRYHWPGNVRELKNMVERAVIRCQRREIGIGDLFGDDMRVFAESPTYDEARAKAMQEFKIRYLTTQLRWADGNVTLAAQRSGIPRQSFHRMLKECGIDPEEFRGM